MMVLSEDDSVLAAEYALGTLAADERAQAETRMAVDAEFKRAVVAWEGQLGTLNQMVGSIEPRAVVWQRIREAIGLATPSAGSEPASSGAVNDQLRSDEKAADSIVASAPRGAAAQDLTNVVSLPRRSGPWRAVAVFTSSIAAALVALLAVQTTRPDLVPWMPKSKQPQVAQTVPQPASPQPPAGPLYVAMLQKDNAPPAYIMTLNGRTRSFTVRRMSDPPEAGKSLELWIVSDKLQRPRSLGLIGTTEFTTRQVLASYDPDVVTKATYAVTLEPEGGSPNGVATGPIVFAGKLTETVPAPTPRPVKQ